MRNRRTPSDVLEYGIDGSYGYQIRSLFVEGDSIIVLRISTDVVGRVRSEKTHCKGLDPKDYEIRDVRECSRHKHGD
jgi:hypothetical protein